MKIFFFNLDHCAGYDTNYTADNNNFKEEGVTYSSFSASV